MENNVNWSGEMVHGVNKCEGDLNLDPQNLIKYGCSSMPVISEQGKVGVEAGESPEGHGPTGRPGGHSGEQQETQCLKQGRRTDSRGFLYTPRCVSHPCAAY